MIFVTDFDGTLYTDSHEVGKKDIETLEMLGSAGIVRVIATGRSLYSSYRVIPKDFPIDYLVFSSGAGIIDWKDKSIIHTVSLDKTRIKQISELLISEKLDFMLHYPVPENHYFYYYSQNNSRKKSEEKSPVTGREKGLKDFERRCSIYNSFAGKWEQEAVDRMDKACQFVVIISSGKGISDEELYLKLKKKLSRIKELHAVRTTSPIDKKTLWVEIFAAGVSKAEGIKRIADMLGKDYNKIGAVGNDYNDIDMLRWVRNSYVVGNAPEDLRKEFKCVGTNNSNGFTEAAEKYIETMKKLSKTGEKNG